MTFLTVKFQHENINDYLAKNRKNMNAKPLGGLEFGVRAPGLPVVPFNKTTISDANIHLLRKLNVTSDNLVGFALETIVNTYVLSALDATRQKAGFNYR